MGEKESTAATIREGSAVKTASPLAVSPEYIKNTQQSLLLLREMVNSVLVYGRDWGPVPGIKDPFLWDAGASQVISAYNCHAGQRRVMSLVNNGEVIAAVLEVPIIHNQTGQELGSGIGAASTDEVKHKYRWVKKPAEWGYSEEAAAALKTKTGEYGTTYRILNPERSELLNTIVKIASKRAEVDAASSMPGAAAALKELFAGGRRPPPAAAAAAAAATRRGQAVVSPAPAAPAAAGAKTLSDVDKHAWNAFWNQAKAIFPAATTGIELRDQVHKVLKIDSMKSWLDSGKSLNDATKILAASQQSSPPPETATRTADSIVQADVPDAAALENLATELWGIYPAQFWEDMGYSGRSEFENLKLQTPFELFTAIKKQKQGD